MSTWSLYSRNNQTVQIRRINTIFISNLNNFSAAIGITKKQVGQAGSMDLVCIVSGQSDRGLVKSSSRP